jgi:hypothetical protein
MPLRPRNLAIGAVLVLGGCAVPMAAGVGVATAVAVPQIVTIVNTGFAVLSDAAKLACATQAFANSFGPNVPWAVRLSRETGLLCRW